MIREFALKLATFSREKVEGDIFKIVKDHENIALDLNLSQLQEGKDSEDKDISPPYREFTKEIKREKGQPIDRVTLFDEGDFYRGFYFEGEQFPIGIFSRDIKTIELIQKYGGEIFGLTEQSKEKFHMELKEDIGNYFRQILQL